MNGGILAGLLSMLGWGVADFLAAKSSRKIGFILTLFFIQIIGFSLASIYFFNLNHFHLKWIFFFKIGNQKLWRL